jgi:sulfoxide reductase catalytic subunit YedY
MLIRKGSDVPSSEITPEDQYVNRRTFMKAAGLVGAIAAGGLIGKELIAGNDEENFEGAGQDDALTPYRDVTTYNNFYEFGTDKGDPARNAGSLRTSPWSIRVDGHVENPATYALEDFIRPHTIEERV